MASPPRHLTGGWFVTNGTLNCVAGGHGGDLITTEQFTDFDFQWDWLHPAVREQWHQISK